MNSMSFENFNVNVNNRSAFDTAYFIGRCCERNGTYNSVYIYGGTFTGKTHLLRAIENAVEDKAVSKNVIYTTVYDYLNNHLESILNHSYKDFLFSFEACDILLVDDLQDIIGYGCIAKDFISMLNRLISNGKIVVMTGNISPESEKWNSGLYNIMFYIKLEKIIEIKSGRNK